MALRGRGDGNTRPYTHPAAGASSGAATGAMAGSQFYVSVQSDRHSGISQVVSNQEPAADIFLSEVEVIAN